MEEFDTWLCNFSDEQFEEFIKGLLNTSNDKGPAYVLSIVGELVYQRKEQQATLKEQQEAVAKASKLGKVLYEET